jgi:hypothetical protein
LFTRAIQALFARHVPVIENSFLQVRGACQPPPVRCSCTLPDRNMRRVALRVCVHVTPWLTEGRLRCSRSATGASASTRRRTGRRVCRCSARARSFHGHAVQLFVGRCRCRSRAPGSTMCGAQAGSPTSGTTSTRRSRHLFWRTCALSGCCLLPGLRRVVEPSVNRGQLTAQQAVVRPHPVLLALLVLLRWSPPPSPPPPPPLPVSAGAARALQSSSSVRGGPSCRGRCARSCRARTCC